MKSLGSALLFFFLAASTLAADLATIRIGVQASGTLTWELAALPNNSTASQSFRVETHAVANAEAGKIALQSGAVDVIVSDWIWASRMRTAGSDFTFYPYSTTYASLIVPEKSPIKGLKDLKGKRLAIAGGELDKNWLLLQALAKQEGMDLNASVEKIYGAPPLLNEQLKLGRVDAMLNYWHFGAKLEAQGYRQVLDGKAILKALGIEEQVPALGYVFKQSWVEAHKKAFRDFLQATKDAKNLLCTSDADWQKTVPLIQVDDVPTQNKLRQRYCEGTAKQWGKPEQQAAERIYGLLRQAGGSQLTGASDHIQAGTFWSSD